MQDLTCLICEVQTESQISPSWAGWLAKAAEYIVANKSFEFSERFWSIILNINVSVNDSEKHNHDYFLRKCEF
jgi:hypothetical protein